MKKKLRSLLRIVFGRTAFMLLFIMLQLAFFFGIVHWISSEYSLISYAGLHLLGTLTCIYIYNKPENPSFKLSWIIPVLAFPVFGTLLYLYVELEISGRIISKRANRLVKESRIYLQQDQKALSHLENEDDRLSGLVNYVGEFGGFPIYENYTAEYFPSGEQKFERLKEELEKARKFIFMEYFIVEHGVMWDTILEILERKSKEGVEVRFMYDGMCSIALLPYHYPKELEAKGIHCHAFAPIKPALSTYQNNRDHRKIVVIDGHTAFTGGVNLADEYINVKERFGYWKDCGIRLDGPGAWGLTREFLHMWQRNGGQLMQERDYYRPHDHREAAGFCQPFVDGPDNNPISTAEDVFLHLINNARRSVHITTPYLAIDEPMRQALCSAGDSGVDVRLLLPGIPDHKFAYLAAQSHYGELLVHHVKIYIYEPGLLHGKTVLSDGEAAFVGSVNMDYRSFQLHFECGTVLYGVPAIEGLAEDIQRITDCSRRVTYQEWKSRPWYRKLLSTLLRLFEMWM